MGGDPLARAVEIGRYGASDIGFLKFFVRFAMNPNKLAKKTQESWKNFYSFGELETENNERGNIEIALKGMPYFSLYEQNFRGVLQGVMELTGEKNASIEIVDEYCYSIKW